MKRRGRTRRVLAFLVEPAGPVSTAPIARPSGAKSPAPLAEIGDTLFATT
jgi:hypothetical protein